MNRVFADANFWIARFNPRNPLHQSAVTAAMSIGRARIVTNEVVLTEFLDYYSKPAGEGRANVAKMVREIRLNRDIDVLPQTAVSFEAGLTLFENRSDKEWGLSDCISMAEMTAQGLRHVLTSDHHFKQAGFEILMQRAP